MSTIESVGEATWVEVTPDDIYDWHSYSASEYFAHFQSNLNPLYLIPSVTHLFAAQFTHFPGVGKVICATSKSLLPHGVNYKVYLNQQNFPRALELAKLGADLSIKDLKGNTLLELLYIEFLGHKNEEMFKEVFRIALKQNPPLMMGNNETLVDFLLTRFIPYSETVSDLLTEALLQGAPFNSSHPKLETCFYFSIIKNKLELTAAFRMRNISYDSHVAAHFLDNLSTSIAPLPPRVDLEKLSPYVTDYTQKLVEGQYKHIKTREVCLKKLMQIFLKKENHFPMIFGKKGCGKTTLVQTLAHTVLTNQAPPLLSGKRVLAIDTYKLLSDLNNNKLTLDDLHQMLKKLDDKTIIFFDDLHFCLADGPLISLGSNYSTSDLLQCFMEYPKIHWIGACNESLKKETLEEPYIKYFFSEFSLEETSRQETFPLIKQHVEKVIEPILGIKIDSNVLIDLIDLCHRFVPNARFPETPIVILHQSTSLVLDQNHFGPLRIQDLEEDLIRLNDELAIEKESKSAKSSEKIGKLKSHIVLKEKEIEILTKNQEEEKQLIQDLNEIEKKLPFLKKLLNQLEDEASKTHLSQIITRLEEEKGSIISGLEALPERVYALTVDKNVIGRVISEKSGVPLNKLTSNEKERLKGLETKLQLRVKGQEEAIKAVSDTIRRSRLGLNGGNRPRGTFLFLGPTGVGKTELAKALAEELLGSEDHMIRIDMSEFQHPADINRLIGSAPGYVGHEEGGKLTEALKKKPYSIVLIDELEKAHPVCMDIFLQVFDDGRLTDGQGETVNCKEAVFIMTSNIGAKTYSLPKEEQKEALDQALKETLRPEFINRIDDILRFNPLDNKEIVRNIAKLQLENLQEKVSKLFSISLTWNEEVIDYLTEKGFSPLFGARPLRNLVEKQLMTLISTELLNETLQDGGKAHFSVKEDQVTLKVVD